jgi:hypothetical protein
VYIFRERNRYFKYDIRWGEDAKYFFLLKYYPSQSRHNPHAVISYLGRDTYTHTANINTHTHCCHCILYTKKNLDTVLLKNEIKDLLLADKRPLLNSQLLVTQPFLSCSFSFFILSSPNINLEYD